MKFDKHHVHPRSRGGANGSWNKRSVDYNLHHGFNEIFMHITVYEAATIIQHCWTDESGKLKYWLFTKKQIETWLTIFGTLNTNQVINKLISELAHQPENLELYKKWLEERKKTMKSLVKEII